MRSRKDPRSGALKWDAPLFIVSKSEFIIKSVFSVIAPFMFCLAGEVVRLRFEFKVG